MLGGDRQATTTLDLTHLRLDTTSKAAWARGDWSGLERLRVDSFSVEAAVAPVRCQMSIGADAPWWRFADPGNAASAMTAQIYGAPIIASTRTASARTASTRTASTRTASTRTASTRTASTRTASTARARESRQGLAFVGHVSTEETSSSTTGIAPHPAEPSVQLIRLTSTSGPRVALDAQMPNTKASKKLEIKKSTIAILTTDEFAGVNGGFPGGTVLNSETSGIKVTAQWYAAKWTIR